MEKTQETKDWRKPLILPAFAIKILLQKKQVPLFYPR